jgi:hypothetical protein
MNLNIQNLDDKWFERRAFPIGYGKFPYIIIKTDYKALIQVPIHFNAENDDYINYPGIQINNVSKEDIAEYEKDKNNALHDQLIEVAKTTKASIEENRKAPCILCLVEGPEIGYYFENDTVSFNKSIPSGGTLVTQENKIIASNVKHYI